MVGLVFMNINNAILSWCVSWGPIPRASSAGLDMQGGYAGWRCRVEMQGGYAGWICRVDMQGGERVVIGGWILRVVVRVFEGGLRLLIAGLRWGVGVAWKVSRLLD